MDDPQLKNEARCCPVQLPLAVSGWVFKEEIEEDSDQRTIKTETKSEMDEPMDTESAVTGKSHGPHRSNVWHDDHQNNAARTSSCVLCLIYNPVIKNIRFSTVVIKMESKQKLRRLSSVVAVNYFTVHVNSKRKMTSPRL